MPQGTGYWLSPTGEAIEIYEHLNYMKKHPDVFGLTIEDIMFTPEERAAGPKGPAMNRERLIKRALVRGWIRFRRAPGMSPTFDVWRMTDDALFRIDEAIRSTGLADRGERIRVIDHRRNLEEVMSVDALLRGEVFQRNPPLQIATFIFHDPIEEGDLDALENWIYLRRALGLIVSLRDNTLRVVNWNSMLDAQVLGSKMFEKWSGDRARELARAFSTKVTVDVA